MTNQDHVGKLVNEYLTELHSIVNKRCFGSILSDCLMDVDPRIEYDGLFKADTAHKAGTHSRFHKIVMNINDWTPNGETERIMSMMHQCTHQCLWEYGGVKTTEHYHKKEFVERMYQFGVLCLDKDRDSTFDAKFADMKPQTGRNIVHRVLNFDHIGDIQEHMETNQITLPVTTIATTKKEPTRVTWECPKCSDKILRPKNKYQSIICGQCKIEYVRKA